MREGSADGQATRVLRPRRIAGLLATGLLLMSGCTDEQAPPSVEPPPQERADHDPPPNDQDASDDEDDLADNQPTARFPVAAEWDWTLETEEGYQVRGNLKLGAVARADEVPLLADIAAPSIDVHCGDRQTDAYIPAALTLTNDTSGFDHQLSNTFHLATTEATGALIQSAPDGLLMAAPLYSGGIECRDIATADDAFFSGGRGWGVSFADPVPPGETVGPHLAYLVLPGYYTPANPDGDTDRLDAVGLAILSAMRSDNARVMSLTGPGAEHDQDAGAFLLSALRDDGHEAGNDAADDADAAACPDPGEVPPASTTSFDAYPEMVIDPDRTYVATVRTSCGELTIELDAGGAPLATNNFVALAQAGYYDGIGFHRVIPDFIIQAGDPLGDGTGGPGYTFEDELAGAEALVRAEGGYPRGTLAMANAGPGTNGSQFFIVTGDPAELDPVFTVFGRLLEGTTVADRIAEVPAEGDLPSDPVRILSIDIQEQ